MSHGTVRHRNVPTASARRAAAATRIVEAPRTPDPNHDPESEASLEEIIFSPELEEDPEEPEDTDEDGNHVPGSPQRGRGRVAIDDVPVPDLEELNDEEKKLALEKYRREKNRFAAMRSRRLKAEIQEAMNDEAEEGMILRKLSEVAGEDGDGYKVQVCVGAQHPTKRHAVHAMRETAEYLGFCLQFRVNNTSRVEAIPSMASPVDSSSFHVVARFMRKESCWEIISSHVTGSRGHEPESGEQKCAYSDADLARHIVPIIEREPGASRQVILASLQPYVRYYNLLSANQITRIRRMASIMAYGVPSNNVKLLPILQDQLKDLGHSFQYETIDHKSMRTVILSCARDEHARLRRAAMKKSDAKRTQEERIACKLWTEGGKQQWLEKNRDVLESVSDPSQKYLSSMFLMFGSYKKSKETLLKLYQLDACSGKGFLSSFTLYVIVGLTANMNIVPVAYGWQCANESEESWSRFLQFVLHEDPHFGSGITISSDRDKGISNAISNVLRDSRPSVFYCYVHRVKNLAKFGKSALNVFTSLVQARSVAEITTIRQSQQFVNLTTAAKDAINSVPDCVQFLAACSTAGGITYGRSSSQAVESQNSHLKSARSLDPLTSVLFVCELEERRFNAHYEKCCTSTDWLPPAVRKRLGEIKPSGVVTYNRAQSNQEENKLAFNVKSGKKSYKVILNLSILQEDDNTKQFEPHEVGDVLSAFGECSCGIPKRDEFPCHHMIQVARFRNIPDELVVPMALQAPAWRLTYPEDATLKVPSLESISCSASSDDSRLDNSLALPITAPTKRGRPPVKRKRHAVEQMRRNLRRNTQR